MKTKTLYTTANISKDILINLFGIELGMINSSVKDLSSLEQYVNKYYTKQQIIDLTLNPAL